MKFVAKHGPFDEPSEVVAKKCDDCNAVMMDNDMQNWLGVWVDDEQ